MYKCNKVNIKKYNSTSKLYDIETIRVILMGTNVHCSACKLLIAICVFALT